VPETPVGRLLAGLLAEPGRPRVTWYDDPERIELSGAVLVNWVTKTANLLVEELDAGPGVRVMLDLPAHWRTLAWALATWRVGACVVLPGTPASTSGGTADDDARAAGGAAAADVIVTDRPGRHAGTTSLVAVALAGLARRFDGPMPAGALDAAAVVLGYGDVLGWVPPFDGDAPALVVADGPAVPHVALLTGPAGQPAAWPRERRLLDATGLTPADLLLRGMATLAADGSLVVVAGASAHALRTDPDRRARLVAAERVTAPAP
jgi:uncharacterized protein (TIGR03089 family)